MPTQDLSRLRQNRDLRDVLEMPVAKSFVPVMLAGSHRRGSRGIVHAVPGPFDWNHTPPALCGAKPGGRSAGFALVPNRPVTCAKCTAMVLAENLEPEGRPTT